MGGQPGRAGEAPGGARLTGVSRLGFGAAPIGNLYRPLTEDQAFAAVAAAVAGGIGYFDTAPHYGFGLSEQRLGAALVELDPGETTRISTKVGRRLEPVAADQAGEVRHGFADALPYEPVFDYGYDAVMRSFEESRARLRRERIDILLAHDLGEATHGAAHGARLAEFLAGGYRAMRRLRDSGAVGAIGVGVNEARAAEDVLAEAELDLVLLAGRYTLLDQGALGHFLPLCAARGVGVILGGPFNSGILARGAQGGEAPQTYDYAPAPDAVRDRVARLERICAEFDTPLAAAALQFCLACPQAVSVIPGLASAAEVTAALALAARPIQPGLWDALRADGLIRADASTPRTVAA